MSDDVESEGSPIHTPTPSQPPTSTSPSLSPSPPTPPESPTAELTPNSNVLLPSEPPLQSSPATISSQSLVVDRPASTSPTFPSNDSPASPVVEPLITASEIVSSILNLISSSSPVVEAPPQIVEPSLSSLSPPLSTLELSNSSSNPPIVSIEPSPGPVSSSIEPPSDLKENPIPNSPPFVPLTEGSTDTPSSLPSSPPRSTTRPTPPPKPTSKANPLFSTSPSQSTSPVLLISQPSPANLEPAQPLTSPTKSPSRPSSPREPQVVSTPTPPLLDPATYPDPSYLRDILEADLPWRIFPAERVKELTEQLRVALELDLRFRRLEPIMVPAQVTKLLTAAFQGDIPGIKSQIALGVDINATNEGQRTALHEAVRGRKVEAVAFLVQRPDCDVNARDALGRTPLLVASLVFARDAETCSPQPLPAATRSEMMALFSLLLGDLRLEINRYDERGRTALSICARAGLEDAVTLLLSSRANVSIATSQNRTPLHFACANGHSAIVKALLDSDADPNVKDEGGVTPLYEAARNGNVSSVLALIRAEADSISSALPFAANEDVRWLLEGRYTSHSHPLKLARIQSPKLGTARLFLSMCPGRCRKHWRRRLDVDLAVLARSKVQCVAVLLTDDELESMGLKTYIEELHSRDLDAVHFPITDKWVPSSDEELSALLELLLVRVRRGKFLLVHCEGGKGRSGFVIAALLNALGHDVEEAIALVQKADSEALSNPAQLYFLRQFARRKL